MALENIDLNQMGSEFARAVDAEYPLLERLRERVRSLRISELNYRQCYAIAPVATDGGQNRLTFEPMNVEIIRVVDSDGIVHFQKVIALSGEGDDIRGAFDSVPVLRKFMDRLEVSELKDLTYLLGRRGKREMERRSTDYRGIVRTVRDIAEWAVLLDLAWNPGRSNLLLIRDGLLRTKALSRDTMPKLAAAFKEAYEERGTLVVGVAKKSKVMNYLSLALLLEGIFKRGYPCYCHVPRDLERECYNWARTWMEEHTFGRLHLVKLVEDPSAIILPVDIPDWLSGRRKEVLEYLAETAKASFPTTGYPEPLIRAHENAVLHGLEMSVLGDLLVDEVRKRQTPENSDRVLEFVSLGRGLITGGWKEYG